MQLLYIKIDISSQINSFIVKTHLLLNFKRILYYKFRNLKNGRIPSSSNTSSSNKGKL